MMLHLIISLTSLVNFSSSRFHFFKRAPVPSKSNPIFNSFLLQLTSPCCRLPFEVKSYKKLSKNSENVSNEEHLPSSDKETSFEWDLLPKDTTDNEKDGDDSDMNISSKAYGNRSLAWTNRYQKLLPYEKARKRAMSLGLRSKDEWDEFVSNGKKEHGPYLPNHPEEMYANDWISWEEFLGCMRPYDQARFMVQNVLKLKDMDEYMTFIEEDTQRAEGLRIPYIPDKVYKDKGWISEDHFFGE